MIQRIQTLLLLLAAVTSALLLWEQMAICNIQLPATDVIDASSPLADGRYEALDSPISAILVGIVTLINILAILIFKNRPRQILLSKMSILFLLAFSIFMGVWFYQNYAVLPDGCQVRPGPGIALPFLTIVLLLLAIRQIASDEKLVKSMDRLR